MDFDALRSFDDRIAAAGRRGARVVSIGTSAGGRGIVALRVAARAGGPRVLVLAGMHARELLGPLAALALVEAAVDLAVPDAELTVVPCVDRDGVAANLAGPFDPRLPVGLPHSTDYETVLPTGSEGAALWPWLLAHGPVDALFSLHSAAHVAPGAFVYVRGERSVLDRWVDAVKRGAPELPWAGADPTGAADEVFAAGVFGFPRAAADTATGQLARRLGPRLLVVPELPPAVAPSLAGRPLAEVHRAGAQAPPDLRLVPLDVQLRVMRAMVVEGIRALG